MATQKETVEISVGDGGSTQKIIKSFEQLHASIEKVNKSITNMAATSAAMGVASTKLPTSTQGSRTAAQMSTGGTSALISDQQNYNTAKGIAGATGAAGRDFAKQSQGLGGLVHLYATFAANLFAVSAAFVVLKNAADTTNMIKGMDQLGAASGRNLGSLAKDLVKITEGAVSMRDAMDATTKAVASGMSGADLKRLAQGAKNASQALGLDMGDALSRLSRGISKIEPELLDELGIFVKVDKAASDYARTLGKPVTALTDLEKRASFASAVLTEVEKKFGNIKLDANPYNQLLSSFKDILQVGLETINKVLGPMLSLLASSPMGMVTAIGAVATMLLKQAIPALGSFRASMQATAEQATKIALAKQADVISSKKENLIKAQQLAETRAEGHLDRVTKAEEKLVELRGQDLNKRTAVYKVLQKAVQEVNDADFAAIEKSAKRAKTPEVAATYREISRALRDVQAEEQAYLAFKEKETTIAQDNLSKTTTAGQIQLIAAKATKAAAASNIVSATAYKGSILGLTAALRDMNAQIALGRKGELTINTGKLDEAGNAITQAVPKMGALQAGLTRIRGTFGALTGAIGTFLNAFGVWAVVIGAAVAGLGMLYDYMSNTSKESKATSEAFDTLKASLENTQRTMDYLRQTDPLAAISIQAIQAKANAFGELTAAVKNAVMKSTAELDKMNGWAKSWNWTKSIVGADVETILAEELTSSIVQGFKLAENTETTTAAKSVISELLSGADLTDNKSVLKAIKDLQELGSVGRASLEKITEQFNKLSKAQAATAAKGTEFKESLIASAKAFDDYTNSLIPSDALSKLALTMVSQAEKLDKALKDPVTSMQSLVELVSNTKNLALFPPETAMMLSEMAPKLNTINEAIANTASEINAADEEMKPFLDKLKQLEAIDKGRLSKVGAAALDKQIAQIQDKVDFFQNKKNINIEVNVTAKADAESLLNKAKEAADAEYKFGAELLATRLSVEWEKAGSTIGKAIAGLLGNTIAGIKMGAAADTQALNTQIEAIKTQLMLIESNYTLNEQLKLNNLQEQRRFEESKGTVDAEIVSKLTKAISLVEAGINAKGNQRYTGKGGIKNTVAAVSANELPKEFLDYAIKSESAYASIANITAQIGAVNLAAMGKLIEAQYTNQAKDLDLQKEKNTILLNQLGTIKQIEGVYAPQLLLQKQQLELSNLQVDSKKSELEIEKVLAVLKLAQKQAPGNADVATEVARVEKQLEVQKQLSASKLETMKAEQGTSGLENRVNLEKINTDLAKQRLDAYKSIGLVTDQEVAQFQAEVDMRAVLNQQELSNTNLKAATQDNKIRLLAVEAEIQTTMDAAKLEMLNKQLEVYKAQEAILASQLQFSDAIYSKKKDTLETVNGIKVAQAGWNDLANILNGIFDTAGNKAGDFLTKLTNGLMGLGVATKEYDKSMKDVEDRRSKLDPINDTDALKKLAKEEEGHIQKRQKLELTANAAILGSAKKLFGEQTAAYKILNGMEKAMYITRMALEAKEFALKIGLLEAGTAAKVVAEGTETAVAEAGFLARAGTYITEIFSKFTAMMGPWGMAAAGVAIAAIGLAAFSGGGSSSGASFVPTSEQMQETQGTGTGWDANGNKIDTGGGVFGDTSAKSASIANSLEIIKNNSVVGLSYDNKMLNALERVADSLTGAAQAIYSIPGLRQGATGFGTLAGSETTQSGLSSIPILGKLFGGSTTADTSIESAGIQLQGSLNQIITDTTGSIQQYKDVLTQFHKDGGWFGSDSDWTDRQRETEAVSAEVSAAISDVFKESKQLFETVATQAGIAAGTVDTVFSSMSANVSIDLMGLKGADVLAELNAVIGTQLDQAASLLFSSFDKFKKFGEGFLETVVRVVDTNQKVQQSLQNIGLQSLGTSLTQMSIEASEALAKTAGGIDKFVTASETFRTTFLSQEEQLVPVIKAVGEEMDKLGFSSIKTKQQFVGLVRSLDLTTEAGREIYQRLMVVSDGFNQVATAAEDARQKILDEQTSLLAQLYKLQGKTNTLRQIELDKLDSSNHQLQLRIWAIEDYTAALNTANTNLTNATTALKTAQDKITTIQTKATTNYVNAQQKVLEAQQQIANLSIESAKKLRDFGLALREFIDTQLGISNNTNTSGLQARFQETVASALTGNQDSIAKVQSLAEQLINSSKASSVTGEQFNQLKASILSSVGMVASYAEAQAALTPIPSEDPLVKAQQNLADALIVQNEALLVAQSTDSSLVIANENLIDQYTIAKQELQVSQDAYSSAVAAQLLAQAALDGVLGTTGDTAIYAGLILDSSTQSITTMVESSKAQIDNANSIASMNNAVLAEIRFNTADTSSTLDYTNSVLVGIASSNQIIANNTAEAARLASQPVDFNSMADTIAYIARNHGVAPNGSANGNVFDRGTQLKFATGGVFSNSIVRTATQFPIGLMGEAGPEAIMPLSRNSRGKLGVAVNSTEPRTTGDQTNRELLQQVAALVEEVAQLRVEARATAVTATKTTRILQRVTRDGESLLTTSV